MLLAQILNCLPSQLLRHDRIASLLEEQCPGFFDWHVWTTWYDDRFEGRVRQEERELAYVRIDDDLWNQGPAIVNAEIKRRIEELTPAPPPIETIPEQEPVATRFRVNSQGLIDVVPDPPTLDPPTDALQRELYNEVREKAQPLVELSPNLRFQESLPERIEDASISRSWSRGNTLRSQLKAHDLSVSRAEPDAARLPPLVAETLRDLVSTWNVFIIGDPKGRELDERRLGPQEVDAARQVIATAALLVQAVQSSENIATPRAIEAVIEQADAATHTPTGIETKLSTCRRRQAATS